MNKSILILVLAFLLISCNDTLSEGEGSSTEVVIGTVLDSNGTPVEGAVVSLYPKDYNPVSDSGNQKLTATTDKSGAYTFEIENPDSYLIICESGTGEKQGAIKPYSSPVQPDTTFDTLSIMPLVEKTVALPISEVDTVGGYLYIPGTDYSVPVDEAEKVDEYYTFTFEGIPQGEIASINYNTTEQNIDDVVVEDGVVVFEPYWYQLTTPDIDTLTGITRITKDSSGAMWFANGTSLFRLQNQTWTTFDTTTGEIKGEISDITADGEKGIWVIHNEDFISYFDGINWTTYDSLDNTNIQTVTSVIVTDKDTIWFGSISGKGPFKYIKSSNSWISETIPGGPSENNIYTMAYKNGALWAARTIGSAVYSDGSWKTYTLADMGIPSDYPKNVNIAPNGDAWFSTYYGLSQFDGSNWHHFDTTNSPLDFNALYEIAHDKENRTYFGSAYSGLNSIYGGVWKNHSTDAGNSPSASEQLFSVTVDSEENVWAAGKRIFVMGPTAEKYSK